MEEALKVMNGMEAQGIAPDRFTYSSIINGLKLTNQKRDFILKVIAGLKVIFEKNQCEMDTILYNSLLDVTVHYSLMEEFLYFKDSIQRKNIPFDSHTYGLCIKMYSEHQRLDEAFELLEQMNQSNFEVSDLIYGTILNNCSKANNMDLVLKLFRTLKQSHVNSIVYTTIIKGFIKRGELERAEQFFQSIKHNTQLAGMQITFNCALEGLVQSKKINEALQLFHEIEQLFGADLITYSTIIKGLCVAERKREAMNLLKQMLRNDLQKDPSVVNLFLESTSNRRDYPLGLEAYEEALRSQVKLNEITFGIMVKLYGFSKNLNQAFRLIALMKE